MKLTYAELETELIKTKKALRETANGQPSEWAYVQLKADADKLAEALDAQECLCSKDRMIVCIRCQALKEYRGE